ncbi:MAG: glycerophosphodiester phosphodiesterase, partial [Acidimicrobiales bacterium]
MAPEISWHRGGGELAPLATLQAFGRAARRGAEWIEVDLRRTADGALVCVHDAELPGVGAVAARPLRDLRPAYAAMPTLDELLDALDEAEAERAGLGLSAGRAGLHLDVKVHGPEADAIEAITARKRPLFVTSSLDASVLAVRDIAPDLDALLTIGASSDAAVGSMIARRGSELWPFRRLAACRATGVASHHLLATPLLRRWCAEHDMKLLVWTVDSWRAQRRWLRRPELAFLTTNRPLSA